jgi:hypothetical protein
VAIDANGNGIACRAFLSLILGLLLTSEAAAAGPCEDIEDRGAFYTVCAFDARAVSLRLFLRDVEGGIIGNFSRLTEVGPERQLGYAALWLLMRQVLPRLFQARRLTIRRSVSL